MQPVDDVRAFLSLGSNLGDRQQMLQEALHHLGEAPLTEVLRVSSLYDTTPVGDVEQPRFLNLVAEIETALPPAQLLWHCMLIEKRLGRVRTRRWGPRCIDIDILLYGDEIVAEEGLTIPHVEMLHRAFVLLPLTELAPEILHPLTGLTLLDHLRELAPEPGVVMQGRLTL